MTTDRELRDLLEQTQRRLTEAERTIAEQKTALAFAAQRERELRAEAAGLERRIAELAGRDADALSRDLMTMRARLREIEEQLGNLATPARRQAAVTVCPRCGSGDLVAAATLTGHNGLPISIGVDGDPGAAIFRDRETTTLFGSVCADCGLVEFSAESVGLLRDAAARRAVRQNG